MTVGPLPTNCWTTIAVANRFIARLHVKSLAGKLIGGLLNPVTIISISTDPVLLTLESIKSLSKP